jgi:hypothetical protein
MRERGGQRTDCGGLGAPRQGGSPAGAAQQGEPDEQELEWRSSGAERGRVGESARAEGLLRRAMGNRAAGRGRNRWGGAAQGARTPERGEEGWPQGSRTGGGERGGLRRARPHAGLPGLLPPQEEAAAPGNARSFRRAVARVGAGVGAPAQGTRAPAPRAVGAGGCRAEAGQPRPQLPSLLLRHHPHERPPRRLVLRRRRGRGLQVVGQGSLRETDDHGWDERRSCSACCVEGRRGAAGGRPCSLEELLAGEVPWERWCTVAGWRWEAAPGREGRASRGQRWQVAAVGWEEADGGCSGRWEKKP